MCIFTSTLETDLMLSLTFLGAWSPNNAPRIDTEVGLWLRLLIFLYSYVHTLFGPFPFPPSPLALWPRLYGYERDSDSTITN
jgi:hypothetical protein